MSSNFVRSWLGPAGWVLLSLLVAGTDARAVPVTYGVVDAPLNATLSAGYKFTFKFSGISNPSRSGSLSDAPLSSSGDGFITADWGTPRTQTNPGVWDEQLAVAAGDLEIVYDDLGGTQDSLGFGVQGVNLSIVLGVELKQLTLTFEEDFLSVLGSADADAWFAFDTVNVGIEAVIEVGLSGSLGNRTTQTTESTTVELPWPMILERTFDTGAEVGSALRIPDLSGLVINPDDFRISLGGGACPIPLCNGINLDIRDLAIQFGTTHATGTSSELIPLPEPGIAGLLGCAALLGGFSRRRGSTTSRFDERRTT